MGWFQDRFAAEAIECPRGWGEVTFALEFYVFPVFLGLERRCPIGGVESCTKCRHPVNPGSAEHLRLQLEELHGLRGSVLSDEEYRIRRRAVIAAQEPHQGAQGRGAAMAAFILGPLGLATLGAGLFLSAVVHLGFLGLAGGGLVLSALAAGFAGISIMQRRSLPKPEELRLDEIPTHAGELEAELGRAREELEFYRELHDGGSAKELRPPDADPPDDTRE